MMETKLEKVMEGVCSNDNVTGCLFADQYGLCLGSKGNAPTNNAGLIVAIADAAARLETNEKPPVILLESDNNSCMIQKNGTITGAIFKNTPNN